MILSITIIEGVSIVGVIITGIAAVVAQWRISQSQRLATDLTDDKATVDQMEQVRLANNDLLDGLRVELLRLRDRAAAAELEAQRCEERCDKCVADLRAAMSRISALEANERTP